VFLITKESRKRIHQFGRRDIFARSISKHSKPGLKSNNKEFEVYTYNDPLAALLEFKPNFYDLLLIDFNLPYMNGFELSERILKLDVNVKICFMSAGEVNHETIRKTRPSSNIGCFIQEPVTIDYLIKRVKAELE
jgi:DNA-binding response OmpR family regulator